jgi:circadian clock protein KaiB
MEPVNQESTRRFERVLAEAGRQTYVLRLYITGLTPASTRAIGNLKALCEERLRGRFQLEVIDIFQRPALAKGEQIIATPTLVKLLPVPMQRFIGDLSGVSGKLFGLDVRPRRERPVL